MHYDMSRSGQPAPAGTSRRRGKTTYHHQKIHTDERHRRHTPHPKRHQKGNARERVWKYRLGDDRDDGEIQRRVFVPEMFLNIPAVPRHTVTYHARQSRVQEHRNGPICETELGSDTGGKVATWQTGDPCDQHSQG
jgi:hypothetical protein